MRYLVIVALLIVSPKIFGQEMEMIGGNLYHNKIPITVSMAVNQSMAVRTMGSVWANPGVSRKDYGSAEQMEIAPKQYHKLLTKHRFFK